MKHDIVILKKTGRFIKKNHILLMSFFLPVIILEIVYASSGIFPFGKWNLLIIDLYHQYAPFISDLQDRLRSFSSLLYSWAGGLGTSYLPLFAYYLASPLNILTVLFPKEFLSEAILFLTLLKVGLAGLFFTLYLRGVHREQGLITVAFAGFYALSSYVLIFSWNIMWMDSIYLLPLIMLGLTTMVRDGRGGIFFCITLAVALLSSFYMSFFIYLFLLLYFPVCLFQYHSFRKPALLVKKALQFAGYSLLSLGLSAILLVPTWFALRLTSAARDVFPKDFKHYFDIFDFISRHFTAAAPSIREGMPNLYSGIIVLILIPVYFFCRSIGLKEKLLHIMLLAALLLSFNIDALNFIWNGFHYPNQIPYRFSFVYIFVVLSMSYKAADRLREFSGKQLGTICVAVFGLIILSQKLDDVPPDYVTLYASMAFIVLYAAALTIDHYRDISPSYKTLFLVIVMIVEIAANTVGTIVRIDMAEGYSTREGYSSGKEVAEIRREISDIAAKDKDFYRMEIIPPKTTNDPYLYNYRGLSLFSSTAPVKPVKMMVNLGFHSNNINSYEYEGSTAILDSLFGIKYFIYRTLNIDNSLYEKTAVTSELTLFTNPYALSLGFQAPSGLKSYYSSSSNPFDAQNSLMDSISGVKNILVPIDQRQGSTNNLTFTSSGTKYYSFKRTNKDSESTARVQFIIPKDQQTYLYFRAPYDMKGSGFVTVGDKKVEFNPRHSTIINLGFCKAGTTPELQLTFDKTAPESGRFEAYASALDIPAFENAISLIKEKSMTVERFTDNYVRGHIETAEAGQMVLTIPYDKGWQVKVDGKETETQAIDNCLLSFELGKGSHDIELRFIPDKFYLGLGITGAAVLILVVLIVLRKRKQKTVIYPEKQ